MTEQTLDANGNVIETRFTSPVTGKVWTVNPQKFERRTARLAAWAAEEARERAEAEAERKAWAAETNGAPTTTGFGVTLYANGNNRAEPQLQFIGQTVEEAREYVRVEVAKARREFPDWTWGETFGDEYAECKAFGFQIATTPKEYA